MPKRILIVEDNDLNRRLFNDVLETKGYETVVSQTGADAVGLAVTTMPDLILMDMCLPDTDGLTTTGQIKADTRTGDIPVIAVTACAMAGDAQRMLAGGCVDYLSKPISIPGLLTCVEKHVH
ncbi:MAG: response regulator [Pseudomonadota bacterium]